jgi:peptidoglycan/LPS O-acetylase OafA/YrhL
MYSQPKRIEFLDSIRGLAALFVLLGHTQGAFAWPAWFYLPAHWPFISIFTSGAEAVAMFFLLSGYVLSKPFVEIGPAPQRKIFLPTFYLRRFIRIWPPWFFAFTASILARKFLFFTRPPSRRSPPGWLVSGRPGLRCRIFSANAFFACMIQPDFCSCRTGAWEWS